jgi:integrase
MHASIRLLASRRWSFALAPELGDEDIHSLSPAGRFAALSATRLRHFVATQMLEAGIPITVVSARLAHARASTTPNVYAHAVPGADREAAEMLADLIRL